jgi:SAM-dependent methyltransferase
MSSDISGSSAAPSARQGSLGAIRRQVLWWMTRVKGMAFDAFHAVDTYGPVPEPMLKISGQNGAHSGRYGYDPTPWNALPRVLRLASLPTQGFTFVDMGCGKGRVLLSALQNPFARIVGVDFSPHLCHVARNNLFAARFLCRQCADATVICADAVTYPIPDGPVMFFFYNPFSYELMEKVLANIVNSYLASRRAIYLIFYATSSQIPLISEFLQRRSGVRQRVRMSIRKRSVYVFEFPQ